MANMSRRRGGDFFPQMGDLPEPYHIHNLAKEPKFTEAGNPEIGMRFGTMPDLTQPHIALAAANNFAHSIQSASPEATERGKLWYPKVHEAVRKGVRTRGFLSGQSDRMLAGAGLVAAVSPNMDWDRSNIDAFAELKGMKGHHWNAIMGAHAGTGPRAVRSRQAARDAVQGLSISSASTSNLQRAGRIMMGDDPETVMGVKGGPKTYNFMHNIADPSNPHHVTIDGRAFDTLTNMVRPWDTGRGISSHMSASGKPTRYDAASGIVKGVSHDLGYDPSAGQAISWEYTKYDVEQAGRTRKQGPMRRGQPYFHPKTGEPAAHSMLPAASQRLDKLKAGAGLLGGQFHEAEEAW